VQKNLKTETKTLLHHARSTFFNFAFRVRPLVQFAGLLEQS